MFKLYLTTSQYREVQFLFFNHEQNFVEGLSVNGEEAWPGFMIYFDRKEDMETVQGFLNI